MMLFSAFLLCLNFSGFIQASKGDPIIGDDVQDFLPDCQARAAEGLCNDKLEFMTQHCPRSCFDVANACAIHTINGYCLLRSEFMKEYCPDSCEDFTATTFKCEDDPEIDCQSVKEHGMCNYLAKDEKSMFVDNKCPVTCQTCPEFVFAAKTRVFKLDTPPSAFSLHNYDHDESLFSSTMDAGAMVEDVSANSVDVCHDVFDSCDQLKLHGECHNSATHQWISAYCPVTCDRCAEVVSESSIPCVDIDLQCQGRKDVGQCQQYKAWMAVHCASSCDYCGINLPRLSSSSVQKKEPFIIGRYSTDQSREVEVTASGDSIKVDNTCRDKDETCAGRASHGQCDRYPIWSSLNCAQSCNDCDGSRSAANVKRKAYLREDDGSGCFDLHEDCFERAIDGGCKSFEGHMFKGCRRSCKHCKPNAPDAEVEELHSGIVTQSPVSASATDEGEDNEDDDEDTCYDKLPHCKDIVRVEGCEKNKAHMYLECAKSCGTCDYLDNKKRCTRPFLNISEAPAFGPGEMGQMFRNLKTKFGHRFNITYLSTSPWVVSIDNFISDDEINAMRGGVAKWYDINSKEYAKDYDRDVGGGRAGLIGWCFGECERASHSVLKRINLVTGVPTDNIEFFQMLHYEKSGDQYMIHHDYNYPEVNTPTGNRVFTFFMYLSNVEEGGETEFPKIGTMVKPKKGRAAMWVNALDSDPFKKDIRTDHQGNPPIKGIKYAANVGVHVYDFRTSMAWRCNWGGHPIKKKKNKSLEG